MPRWLVVLQTLVLIGWVAIAVGWLRLSFVSEYRRNLIREVGDCVERDVEAGREWRWRWAVYDSVTFNQMMWQPWKPVSWFYADAGFTTCR